jgi:lysophospholipase L1-like esterase
VALGDSLTQGYGLVEEDGFVPQLQAWLRARGNEVVVENHGVSGDTTAGGLARIGWALGDHVDALIVALGGNDLLRGLPPEVSRANLDGILAEAEARGSRPACRAAGAGQLRAGLQGGVRRDVSRRWRCNTARYVLSRPKRLRTMAGALARIHAARWSSIRTRTVSP